MLDRMPNAPYTGFRLILDTILQVATGFLITLAAALVLLQIEVTLTRTPTANPQAIETF
jgi:hypothetical protein